MMRMSQEIYFTFLTVRKHQNLMFISRLSLIVIAAAAFAKSPLDLVALQAMLKFYYFALISLPKRWLWSL